MVGGDGDDYDDDDCDCDDDDYEYADVYAHNAAAAAEGWQTFSESLARNGSQKSFRYPFRGCCMVRKFCPKITGNFGPYPSAAVAAVVTG